MDPLLLVGLIILAILLVGGVVRRLLGCAVKLALFVLLVAVVLWLTGNLDLAFLN